MLREKTNCRAQYWPGAGLAFAGIGLLYLLAPNILWSFDEYYHFGIAQQGWQIFTARKFPTVTLSIWTDCFSDKELGFHILLNLLSRIPGCGEPPFTGCRILLFGLLLTAFAGCLYRYRGALPWLFMPLLAVSETFFTQRMLQVRPQVLSAALMLFAAVIFSRADNWKRRIPVFLICFIYAWSYSNPHFILLPLGAFAVAYFISGMRERGSMLFLTGALGLAAGLIIHPQFPNNLINWYVQCVMVVRNMISPSGVILGTEMRWHGWILYRKLWLITGIAVFNLVFSLWLRKTGRNKKFSPELAALIIIAGITAAGLYFSIRTAEYTVPFNLLCCSVLLNYLPSRKAKTVFAVLLIVLAAGKFAGEVPEMRRSKAETSFADTTAYISENLPAGTVIGHLSWGDFPELYYRLPHYRFLFGLDPYFCYCVHPDEYMVLQRYGYDPSFILSAAELKELTGTGIILVSSETLYRKVARIPGSRTLFTGQSSAVVKLP